jgi:hypothetical protein
VFGWCEFAVLAAGASFYMKGCFRYMAIGQLKVSALRTYGVELENCRWA